MPARSGESSVPLKARGIFRKHVTTVGTTQEKILKSEKWNVLLTFLCVKHEYNFKMMLKIGFKSLVWQGMTAHAFSPGTQEAEAGGSL